MNYCLVPLGCQMNQSDSERICSVLERLGFKRTEVEEDADLLGVVACSVRQKAIDRVYAKIAKWNRWKSHRNLLTFVSGCILPADREKFLDRFDLLFTINELPDLPNMMRQYGVVTPFSHQLGHTEASVAVPGEPTLTQPHPGPTFQQVTILGSAGSRRRPAGDDRDFGAPFSEAPAAEGAAAAEDSGQGEVPANHHGPRTVEGSVGTLDLGTAFWKIRPTYFSSFEAYVPIQNGCDKFCTFCAVPYTRGREVSRASDEILSEVRRLVASGYKSITLLGQNVNSYGLDRSGGERSFADLLRAIGEIGQETGKRFWVYFTSPHPRDMTDEVLEVIAQYPCLAKQLHLPIQSGDDKVLIRMNRSYRVSTYRRIVENIRRILPNATLFTDIIVGFTGETQEQFENTRNAMREFRYNMAYVAMYSPRPGAASSRWDDDVPLDEKKRRLHLLSEELQRSSLAHNQAMIGTRVPVLVDGRDRKAGFLSGKTEGRLVVRFESDNDSLIGSFVTIEVTSCAALSLTGRLASAPVEDVGRIAVGANSV